MRKRPEPSIKNSMVKSITFLVLLPLSAALLVLCVLMQRSVSLGIMEAYQLMFDQNVREINSAVVQSTYASSTMITYTENNQLLKDYYDAATPYQKDLASKRLREMLLNCNVTNLGSFGGEMILLTSDGHLISSDKIVEVPESLYEEEWYKKMEAGGRNPYWDPDICRLFDRSGTGAYVAFGRALVRYQENQYGYALVLFPDDLFVGEGNDPRYRKGGIALFSSDGRILAGENQKFSNKTMAELLEQWDASGGRQGRYGDYYVMGAVLASSRNRILYVGNRHEIFERSEQIFAYLWIFMTASTALFLGIAISISGFITEPILFFADKIRLIEQSSPQELALGRNHFQETRMLEEGMLNARRRIHLLLEEVRQETVMKEKARFDALKAQINPHFLFNTLNAIRWKASINEDHEVADILLNLGVLLSETYKHDQELETLRDAVHILEAYGRIMQVRFGNQVEFFFVIPEELEDYLIPRFCLQPLVENSFIHGMSHVDNGVIALRGELDGEDIELTLIDNGSGLQGKVPDLAGTTENNKRGITGIGLSNIHKRIQMIYGEGYGLTVDTEVELGFRITLRIPAVKRGAQDDESTDN